MILGGSADRYYNPGDLNLFRGMHSSRGRRCPRWWFLASDWPWVTVSVAVCVESDACMTSNSLLMIDDPIRSHARTARTCTIDQGCCDRLCLFFFSRMLRPAASEFITIASSFFLLFFFRRLRFLVQQRQTHSLVRISKGRHST